MNSFLIAVSSVHRKGCIASFSAAWRTFLLAVLLFSPVFVANGATNWTLVGWNNLGMHCLDSDYSVFSILPPYNTFNAQLIRGINGSATVFDTGIHITYQAVADPDGSLNTTSQGKSDFWQYVYPIFGLSLPMDVGLPVPGPGAYSMPGASNIPQVMGFEFTWNWFVAYGVPIIPYDDKGKPNQYPMMRLVAKNGPTTLATTDIVLPVSDEMNCRLCHLSGSGPAAKPAVGWVDDQNPGRDYRLNILRLHDEKQAADPVYAAALATNGFNAAGLFATVTVNNQPFLCAACHLSEALPGTGLPGIKALTAAVHGRHATVIDPRTTPPLTLDNSSNRTACYTCHPGSVTRCLRGAMGKAVAADGSLAMQCQSCHGTMSTVGDTNRIGWLEEPNCQACHTGDAVSNSGQIRYTSAYTNGVMRDPLNQLFATTPDEPGIGFSLYRFSTGHGGVMCSGCHGSTHAEFPSAFRNDNITSTQHQGHVGLLVECNVCHGTQPANNTVNAGPHGMHPIGTDWASGHHDAMDAMGVSYTQCRGCHGVGYHGSVLSRVQKDSRSFNTDFGSRIYWRGQMVSCYDCHNGPTSEGVTPYAQPVVTGGATSTTAGNPVSLGISVSNPNGSTPVRRIVSQPANGTVALSGSTATYYPNQGFFGTDLFTVAAADAFRDSNLATGTVTVTQVFTFNDGVPDWWRALNFGTGAVTTDQSCAVCDPDGDGFSNAAEFAAGTDPNDIRSRMRIFNFRLAGADATFGFTTLLGKQYEVQTCTNLVPSSWTVLQSNVWGKTDSVSITDPGATTGPQRFYRVRVLP